MIPVAIFVRVSKGSQDYTRQIADLTALCQQRNYSIAATIKEKISGATKNKDREAIQELMQLVNQRQIKKVLVTEVSRLGRHTSEVLEVVEDLSELGISIYVQNYNMETLKPDGSRNNMAQTLFTFLAEFARLERENLRERISSGIQAAKRKGVVFGRPKGSKVSAEAIVAKYPQVVRQLRAGKSMRDVAAICEVGISTVQRVKKAMR